jgi:hypothetical protein
MNLKVRNVNIVDLGDILLAVDVADRDAIWNAVMDLRHTPRPSDFAAVLLNGFTVAAALDRIGLTYKYAGILDGLDEPGLFVRIHTL